MELRVIARVRTDFPTKFGLPRQSGLVPELRGVVEFEEEFRIPEALRGLEGFSHIWLLWGFSEGFASRRSREGSEEGAEEENSFRWSPTVRPPRLGGNERMGVFATRSPNRPNPIGLSVVRLDAVELRSPVGPRLLVSGVDMKDGTPVYDIKPYLPLADRISDASGGFSESADGDLLTVSIPSDVPLDLTQRETLAALLRGDPRPSYQREDGREYGFPFAGFEIRFVVRDGEAIVTSVEKK